MDFIDKTKILAKRLSTIFQRADSSYAGHNSQYAGPAAIEEERRRVAESENAGVLDLPEFDLQRLLQKYPNVRDAALDIGSGAGWPSSKLSRQFKRVISIEPSAKGQEIAATLYPVKDFPNIERRIGFAEQVMKQLSLDKPALFFTSVVLSHLRDKEVSAICQQVNRLGLPGSILCFNECWGVEHHQNMWHVRTKEWWQKQLPGWALDFRGPEIQGIPGRHKGIHGVKIS